MDDPYTKVCCKCKQEKHNSLFYANKRTKDGINSFCIECHKAYNRAKKAQDRANPEFRAAELAYKKQYRERTVQQRAEYMTKWRDANKERISQYGVQYRNERKEWYNYLCQKRKIDLINRTPAWLTNDDLWMIAEAYKLAKLRAQMLGGEWHVDHIIPLRGRNVSGLHVPTNLRVIPRAENQHKTNKFEV